jgi:putative tricarboxylic transport membrane protein
MFVLMFVSIKYMAKLVYVPKQIIYPIIIVMCVVGAYAINNGVLFDVWTLVLFGIAGLVFAKIGIQVAPFLIGFILGTDLEKYFIDSLKGSGGDLTIFVTKGPIAIVLWLLILASIAFSFYQSWKSKKTGNDIRNAL